MQSKNNYTQKLIVASFFIAIEIILTRWFSINIGGIVRIGFAFIPISFLGIIYGPLWAGISYAVGDLIGMMLFPSGAFFPGFTLTAFLTGLVFGLFLHNKEITYKRVAIACFIVCFGLNLCLDTLWLVILMNKGFFALLPARIIKTIVAFCLQVVLIPFLWKNVFSRIPQVKQLS